MKLGREQGLCYNCDEKYKLRHLCKSQQLYILIADDELVPTPPTLQDDTTPLVDSDLEISINALTGQVGVNTIRITETIKKKKVLILIDSGSTQLY